MLKKLPILTGFCLALFSCNAPKSDIPEQQGTANPDSATVENTEAFTQDDQENIQRLIRLTLTDLFKEDLERGFLDSASRKITYDQVDLNGDGNLEIFVGMTGSYFCGSGGCTIYLLSNQGDVITRFTVVDYPVWVGAKSTKDWKNLIMYSGRENRLVTFDGHSYPSNPSVMEVYKEGTENLTKVLDPSGSKELSF